MSEWYDSQKQPRILSFACEQIRTSLTAYIFDNESTKLKDDINFIKSSAIYLLNKLEDFLK